LIESSKWNDCSSLEIRTNYQWVLKGNDFKLAQINFPTSIKPPTWILDRIKLVNIKFNFDNSNLPQLKCSAQDILRNESCLNIHLDEGDLEIKFIALKQVGIKTLLSLKRDLVIYSHCCRENSSSSLTMDLLPSP